MIIERGRWQAIDAILDAVMELPEGEQQEAVGARCHGDRNLFNDVMEFLPRAQRNDELLERNAMEIANTFFAQQFSHSSPAIRVDGLRGLRIGAFVLDHEIGRGGMGVVYRAHRVEGDFKQIVAIKLMLCASVAVAERFRREQQVLATLTHPNITKLYDGGITEQGHPYLVMEFIEGVPITDYCQENHLDLVQRLQLLDQVLEALAFSHKNLVVHRDIKPSNILVTATGQVKLLDFSIAKLLDGSLDFEQTATHFHLFTPGFSAPEQLLNKPVSVVTDIYQVGLLYYRLLTGSPPFDLDASSLSDLINKICQQEVARPSAMVENADTNNLLTHPEDWSRQLRGDLDAIILKMLRKEVGARYQSVASLQSDLHAHRHHLPVSARQAAFNYQAAKFMRRHWKALSILCVAILSLGGYTLTVIEQNKRIIAALDKAETEQRKAQQVAKFLAETFEAADPNKGGLAGITAKDLLEQAGARINTELQDAPEIRATLLNIFGVIYFRQQDYQKADRLLTGLLQDESAVNQLNTHLLAESKLRLAQHKMGLGAYATAKSLIEESLSLQTQKESPTNNQQRLLLGQSYAFGGLVDLRMKNRESALTAIHKSIRILSEMGAEGDDMRAFALNILADDQYRNNQPDIAIENMHEVISLKRRAKDSKPTEISRIQIGLANMLLDQNRLDEAKALAQAAIRTINQTLPESHPYQLISRTLEAKIEQRLGNLATAENILISAQKQFSGEYSTAAYRNCALLYAEVMIDGNKLAEAEQNLLKIAEQLTDTQSDLPFLARVYALQGRLDMLNDKFLSAAAKFRRAQEVMGPSEIYTAFVRRDLASSLIALQNYADAKIELESSSSMIFHRYHIDHPQFVLTCKILNYYNDHTAESSPLVYSQCEKSISAAKPKLPNYLTRVIMQ